MKGGVGLWVVAPAVAVAMAMRVAMAKVATLLTLREDAHQEDAHEIKGGARVIQADAREIWADAWEIWGDLGRCTRLGEDFPEDHIHHDAERGDDEHDLAVDRLGRDQPLRRERCHARREKVREGRARREIWGDLGRCTRAWMASYTRMTVMIQTIMMLASAPMTSARWYPNEYSAFALRLDSTSASTLTRKPATSESMCAASVMTASECASRPPTCEATRASA